MTDGQPGAEADRRNPIEHLLKQEPGMARLVRVQIGGAQGTALAAHEDWEHAGALPEEPSIQARAGVFLRNGVALIPVLVRVENETYEAWINAHNPAGREYIPDLRDQTEFLMMFFVDGTEPVRIITVPNPFRAAFQRYAEAVAALDPWPMTAFDREKANLYAEFPSVQALWDALAQPTDLST